MAQRWRAKSNVGARVDDEECAQQIPKSHACKEESTNRPRSWITSRRWAIGQRSTWPLLVAALIVPLPDAQHHPPGFRQVLALPVVVDFGPRRTWML